MDKHKLTVEVRTGMSWLASLYQRLQGVDQKRRSRVFAVLAALWAAVIFMLSSVPGSGLTSVPSKLSPVAHFMEYMMLAALLFAAFSVPGRKPWLAAVLAVGLASLYGASDELHQLFVPGRNCDPMDWLVDSLGACVSVAGLLALRWLATRGGGASVDE